MEKGNNPYSVDLHIFLLIYLIEHAPNIKAPFTIANGDFIEKVKLYYIKGKGIVGVIYMTKKGLA